VRQTLLALAFATLAAAGGCQIRPPEVHLHDIQITDMSFRRIDLVCWFTVLNPNPYDAVLSDFTYTMTAAGQQIARGAAVQPIPKVPGIASEVIPVGASIDLRKLREAARNYTGGKPVPYQLAGRPVFCIAGLNIPVDVRHAGEVPRIRLPAVSVRKVSLQREPERAVLIDLDVTNRCTFEVSLAGLHGDLTVGGESILAVREPSTAVLPPGKKVRMTVPVRVGVSGAAKAAWKIIATGKAPSLDAELKLKSPPTLRQLLLGSEKGVQE